jgi:hypothetical protein
VAVLIIKETKRKPQGEQKSVNAPTENMPPGGEKTFFAYYFHGNLRCSSCITIENFTATAIRNCFDEELKSGRLEWKVINVEEPGNEHFVKDFNLFTQQVILVEKVGGKQTRWKNLDQVWSLLNNESQFVSYIQSELSIFMEG